VDTTARRDGFLELADGGTLFLDELAEMSLAMQAKLLRAIDQGEIRRLGADRTQHVDVRVIAATNKDLRREVALGQFVRRRVGGSVSRRRRIRPAGRAASLRSATLRVAVGPGLRHLLDAPYLHLHHGGLERATRTP
jgi:hypothetical protein